MAHGSWHTTRLKFGTWIQVGFVALAHGSWICGPGLHHVCSLAHGSWIRGPGPWILDLWPWPTSRLKSGT